MRNKKAAFLTLGCKVNQYETDAMEEILRNAGYSIVDFKDEADVYIINTCSVTNVADKKSRQMIHRARKMNPNAVIVAAGCYVQAAQEKLEQLNIADVLVGNNRKKEIDRILEEYFLEHQKEKIPYSDVIDIAHDREYESLSITNVTGHTRAYLKVQDGCNQFCSYCIIPYTRGRIRSEKLPVIMREVRNLAGQGFKEIVLTGIHLSSYGLDQENLTLLDLIREVASVEGIERIRLGSLEPRIITEEFVKELSGIKKVCPHFHLSLQSGCDETLKRMNRKYDTKEYARALEILRKYYKHPALTTDVIVGFVGETEEEFQKTAEYLEKINLYEMHIFKYSVREGTRAQRMEGHLPESVKTERSAVLLEMTKRHKRAYEEWYVGKEEQILLEEAVTIDGEDWFQGFTKNYVKVAVKCSDAGTSLESNMLLDVHITGFADENLLSAVIR